MAEPDIEPIGRVRDGVRTFAITYDWLRDEFIDHNRGPWQVLAVVVLVLTTIGVAAEIPLPRLVDRPGNGR